MPGISWSIWNIIAAVAVVIIITIIIIIIIIIYLEIEWRDLLNNLQLKWEFKQDKTTGDTQ